MFKITVPLLALGAVVLANTVNGQSNEALSDSVQLTSEKRVWISIGTDAVNLINEKYHSQISLNQVNLYNSNSGTVATASIPASQIDSLSELMHEEFNRCAGFIFHESYSEAQTFALTPSQLAPSISVSYSIDNSTGVNALLNELNASNLSATVNTLSNYNNRYYTQQSGVDAANWIKNEWSNIASSRNDISVSLYNHSWAQPSVIATINGTTNPEEIVVIGGHLDSINGSNPSYGRAPGSDDNASGIAIATETLRALVASGYKPQRTVKLMGYAAEEVGLRGSKAIAQQAKSNGDNVVGVVQFDMSGFKGTSNRDIVFMTDYTNSAQNQFLANLLDTYHPGISYGYDQCGYGCSDHASWHNQGFAASMPFESNMGDINPRIHTSNDSTYDANHSFNFVKLAVTYLAELAKGGTGSNPPPPPPNDQVLENGVAKTGLGASTGQDIVFTMEVPTGATDIQFSITGGSGDADLYVKFASTPTDSSYDCRPYRNGNNETCSGSATGGTYYVRLKAYTSFSNVTLTGSYTEGGGNTNPPIDRTITNIGMSQGQWKNYTENLSAGYANLTVTISGGSGDADLYVRHGAQSTTSLYDCRPYRNGNSETCSFNAPAAGTWHIDLRGYRTSSGVTLNIQATP
ncbi:M20/M25/M40 family metallo-hydrolase [Aliikangiella sp. IMCC44653]